MQDTDSDKDEPETGQGDPPAAPEESSPSETPEAAEPPLFDDQPPPPEPPAPTPPRRKSRLSRRLFVLFLILTVVAPVGLTLVYRIVPPPLTVLMVQRMFDGRGLDRHWRPISKISPALPRAVIAAEDARFCEHGGFDFEAIEKAMRHNERRPGRIRGGSTISQQTAKNVFLWPQRSYVRKGLEAYFTVLIETFWGKRRIMEVYLNTVEWGPGVYGAEAAARRNFGISAADLTAAQAARLAAILPSPLKWKAAHPGPYVSRRSRRIDAAAGTVRREGLADCIGKLPRPRSSEPPARRETRRRAAEEIMRETAVPLPPEEEVAAPVELPADEPAPQTPVQPEVAAPPETPPAPEETPAAP